MPYSNFLAVAARPSWTELCVHGPAQRKSLAPCTHRWCCLSSAVLCRHSRASLCRRCAYAARVLMTSRCVCGFNSSHLLPGTSLISDHWARRFSTFMKQFRLQRVQR
jgi:hypothetical protein